MRTYIASATFYFYCYTNYFDQNTNVYLLNFDPSQPYSAQMVFDSLGNGPYLGAQYVSTSSTLYSLSLSGTGLTNLRSMVSKGSNYIFFGLTGTSGSTDYNVFHSPYSYLTINGDMEAPNTPSIFSASQYTSSSYVSLDWADVSDLPTAPNWGSVKYQVGAFSSTSTENLVANSPWTSYSNLNFYNLEEGTYYFRTKAKDAGGFETGWSSSYTSTLIDRTPPLNPTLMALPEYNKGTSLYLDWTDSLDSGSGLQFYIVAWATMPDYSDETDDTFPSSKATYLLTPGTTYYFSVAALDNAGIISSFSSIAHTTCDNDPPSVPVMKREPLYTKGDTNIFEWHPALDAGVGVKEYEYQVASAQDFASGSIVVEGFTTEPFCEAGSLSDGTRYYARVRAYDEFDFVSPWSNLESSIQDITGPDEMGLSHLQEYMMDGPVGLEWGVPDESGSGVGWYKVEWSKDSSFASDVSAKDHVMGQNLDIEGLEPGQKWYFRVTPFDTLGNPGTPEVTSTTIDGAPPTKPMIDPLQGYTAGKQIALEWEGSSDALSGMDHYIINVYTTPDRAGQVFTLHTSSTEFTVPALMDGVTYYYEVCSLDKAGNMVQSDLQSSTQDSSGPSTPYINEAPDITGSGLVPIYWDASQDEGVGGVEYSVSWSMDRNFMNGVHTSNWVTGTSLILFDKAAWEAAGGTGALENYPLPEGTWFARVSAKDSLGIASRPSPTRTIAIDRSSPPSPVLSELQDYTGGSSVKLSWEPVNDSFGGDVEYRISVRDNLSGELLSASSWVQQTEYTAGGLGGERRYDFSVESRDRLGWVSPPSEKAQTTMDKTPPIIALGGKGAFGASDTLIHGTVLDTGCGPESVEISFDGGLTWSPCALLVDRWSFPMVEAPQGSKEALIRATDAGGNTALPVVAPIDLIEPSVTIISPVPGSKVSGTVQITGAVEDDNLEGFSVDFKRKEAEEWSALVPEQRTDGYSGILATWVTAGLPGGEYLIRVRARDALDQVRELTVNYTLSGAVLVIEPSQITFSNPHPAPGDKVDVLVTVKNLGDSPAEDVTVVIYDGGTEIGRQEGITVPANGFAVVSVELKVKGSHEITARATSDLYDSKEMTEGAALEAYEETPLEDYGWVMGCLAILIALIALLLALVLSSRRKKDKKPKEEKAKEKEPETKEPPKETPSPPPQPTTPALQPSQKPAPQALPSSTAPQVQAPLLPPPTVAPATAPSAPALPIPPPLPPSPPSAASVGTPPPQPLASTPQPMLNAAPQSPPPAQSITYVAPTRSKDWK